MDEQLPMVGCIVQSSSVQPDKVLDTSSLQSGIKADMIMLGLCINGAETREIGKSKSAFLSRFQLQVVDNLIPTLSSWVAAGQCLAEVEHDKQFER